MANRKQKTKKAMRDIVALADVPTVLICLNPSGVSEEPSAVANIT